MLIAHRSYGLRFQLATYEVEYLRQKALSRYGTKREHGVTDLKIDTKRTGERQEFIGIAAEYAAAKYLGVGFMVGEGLQRDYG